jgi:hypothetical protein
MNVHDKQSSDKKEYSYLIYIASCLAIPVFTRLAPFGRITESSIDAKHFAFNLTLFFIFCSLAWVVGRRYELGYLLRCALGGAAFLIPAVVKDKLLLEEPLGSVLFVILGAFMIGTLLLAVSYPFQFLFSKLRS